MSNWPIPREGVLETAGANTALSTAIQVGTNTELIAATERDWSGFWLFSRTFSVDRGVRVSIGPAGSEAQLFNENFAAPGRRTGHAFTHYCPIAIPKGVRVAGSGNSIKMLLIGEGGGFNNLGGYTKGTVHRGSTQNRGVIVDAGSVIHTKGAYTEVATSISDEYKALLIIFDNLGNNTIQTTELLVDIAIGAAGSEIVVIANLAVSQEPTGDQIHPGSYTLPIVIPIGTRIAARAQANNITAGIARQTGVTVVGFS